MSKTVELQDFLRTQLHASWLIVLNRTVAGADHKRTLTWTVVAIATVLVTSPSPCVCAWCVESEIKFFMRGFSWLWCFICLNGIYHVRKWNKCPLQWFKLWEVSVKKNVSYMSYMQMAKVCTVLFVGSFSANMLNEAFNLLF